jgi:hypothetical protein
VILIRKICLRRRKGRLGSWQQTVVARSPYVYCSIVPA